jgi:RHS repeat-associated protein
MVSLTGGVVLEATGSTRAWYYPDLQGSTAAEASSAGTAVGGVTLYDPFGNTLTSLQSDSPDGLAYGFEGKHGIGTETDGVNTVVLMGARLYDPTVGAFLQVDPVFGGSANAYDYVDQDPVNNTDLNGEWCWFGNIGTTCTRYVTDMYGRSVPVQYRMRQKVLTKHGISWGTLQWLISNLPQVGGSGTQVVYGGQVNEYQCSGFLFWGSCSPTGNSVYVRLVVDFKVNSGRTFGLVTAFCVGVTLCPNWINSDVKL